MKDNKGTTILLTVIGVATLLVAVVGATFAYFTATVTNETPDKTDITVDAATVGSVAFDHGNVIDLCDDTLFPDGQTCVVYPGAQEAKTFTVTGDTKSTVDVPYVIYLEFTKNTFTDWIDYKLSGTSTKSGDIVTTAEDYTNLAGITTKTQIGSGVLKAGNNGDADKHTWTLDVRFENLDQNQNAEMNKQLSAKIVVEAAQTFSNDAQQTTTAS